MKRRDFVKTIAASYPASLIASSPLVSASPLKVSNTGIRNKVVFISDIHLNVDAEYSWISQQHLNSLTAFLLELNDRPDVAEFVILGDLIDDWVVPVKNAPNSFESILSDQINSQVVTALQALSRNPQLKVSYLTGNHDLLSWQQQNKIVIQTNFPGMQIISEYPGNGSWSMDKVVWAEHGHRYCLFNAADIWSKKDSQLPLGYFMARLAATASVNQHQKFNTLDLLYKLSKLSEGELRQYLTDGGWNRSVPHTKIDRGIYDDAFIRLAYYAEAAWSNSQPSDKYVMNGVDSFAKDPTVWRVGQRYDQILSKWPIRQDRVPGVMALFDDLGALSNAADVLFRMPAHLKDDYPFTPKIVLFGHTHKALIQNNTGEGTIYVNTGTWIDGKPMTWAEIETTPNENGQTYTVTLWDYGNNTQLGQASITV